VHRNVTVGGSKITRRAEVRACELVLGEEEVEKTVTVDSGFSRVHLDRYKMVVGPFQSGILDDVDTADAVHLAAEELVSAAVDSVELTVKECTSVDG
jgi:hypothetical protein